MASKVVLFEKQGILSFVHTTSDTVALICTLDLQTLLYSLPKEWYKSW